MTVRLYNFRTASGESRELFYTASAGTSRIIDKADISDEPRVVNCGGRLLLPAFTDVGCEFFDPEFPQRDTLRTASASASAGGYRRLLTLDDRAVKDNDIRVKNALPLPTDPEKIEVGGIYFMKHGGACDLKELFSAAKRADALIISAGIDEKTVKGSYADGIASKMTGEGGISRYEECGELAKELFAAYESGCRFHVRAIASAEALQMIREAKASGASVTAGVSPFHLSMTENDVAFYGSACKLLPPLRSAKDREALREGLFDGSIDCVSSLHTPRTRQEKDRGAFGLCSFETVLPALMTYMPELHREAPQRLEGVLSAFPSALIGEDFALKVGQSADFVLVDTESETVITENTLKTKSLNTMLMGQTVLSSLRLYLNGTEA